MATRLYTLPLFQAARGPLAACLLGMLLSRLYRAAQDELGDTLFALAAANWSDWHLSILPGRRRRLVLAWRAARLQPGHLHGMARSYAPRLLRPAAQVQVRGAQSLRSMHGGLALAHVLSHRLLTLGAPAGVVDTRLSGLGPSERAALLALWGGADLDAHSFERRLHAFLNDAAYYERSCVGGVGGTGAA